MKIIFNELGAVIQTITNDEPLRQGNVGNTITATFQGKNNLEYLATLNFKRADGKTIVNTPMNEVDTQPTDYTYSFDSDFFFAVAGETEVNVFLHDAFGNVIASGTINFSIERTTALPNKCITQDQYNDLLALIADKMPWYDSVQVLEVGEDLPLVGERNVLYLKPTNNDIYERYVWNDIVKTYMPLGDTSIALKQYQKLVEKGQANGYVPLDKDRLIPSQYIAGQRNYKVFPTFGDFPPVSEAVVDTIYIAKDTKKEYIIDDEKTEYIEISEVDLQARNVAYDRLIVNLLEATNVQTAIDELASGKINIKPLQWLTLPSDIVDKKTFYKEVNKVLKTANNKIYMWEEPDKTPIKEFFDIWGKPTDFKGTHVYIIIESISNASSRDSFKMTIHSSNYANMYYMVVNGYAGQLVGNGSGWISYNKLSKVITIDDTTNLTVKSEPSVGATPISGMAINGDEYKFGINGLDTHVNFYNKAITLNSAQINTRGDITQPSQYWNLSDYVLLKANTTYYTYGTFYENLFCCYNLDKQVIAPETCIVVEKGTTNYNNKFIIGNQDIYMRFSILQKYNNEAYISPFIDKYVPYEFIDLSYKYCDKNTNKIENLIEQFNQKVKYPIINIFDKAKEEKGKSIRPNGDIVANKDWSVSDYIYLEANTEYYVYGSWFEDFFCCYNLNKQVVDIISHVRIEKLDNTRIHNKFIVLNEPIYMRFSMNNALVPNGHQYVSKYIDKYYDYGVIDYSFDYCTYLKEKVDKLDNASNFKKKKVLVIGDSISTDNYQDVEKWVSCLIDEGFFEKANVVNNSIHATGFVARYNNQPNDFISRIQAVADKETFDLVVIFGGINDFIQSVPMGNTGGDITKEFKPAVDWFFDYLTKNFSQARLCVLTPLRTYNIYPSHPSEHYQQEYSAYIKGVAENYALPVLDLTKHSGFCPFVENFKNKWTIIPKGYETHDGVHPTYEYSKLYLAPMIREFLKGLL